MTKNVHFIGIGGIGMSALARYFLAAHKAANPERSRRITHAASSGRAIKWLVSGSDLVASAITKELAKEGIKVKIGHKEGNISSKTGLVVHNRAIKRDNPELLAARRLKIPTIAYSEALGALTESYKTIAVTGSHGKSTTTALAGLVCIRGGIDPTVFVGTNLNEFGGKNLRLGKSKYLVIEADDFGAAFLDYSPTISIVTNIDKEHLDFYKNFSNIKRAFIKFLTRTKRGGALILNKDDKTLLSLKSKVNKIAKARELKIYWYSIKHPVVRKVKKIIKVPGEHNISNALAAYYLGKVMQIPEKKVLSAISKYRGAWRRMEYRGKFSIFNFSTKGGSAPGGQFSIRVFDDYAHHPTEIKATLKAFREKFPRSPIACVFQPHQTERLRALFKDFVGAFDDTDVLILLPIYKVPGRESIKYQVSSIKLANAIKKKYPQKLVFCLSDPKGIKSFLKKILLANDYTPSPVIIMMGAGDIVNYTDLLLRK